MKKSQKYYLGTETIMITQPPIMICRLCNKDGDILNAYEPSSIRFTELTSPENRLKRRVCLKSGKTANISMAVISIEGYISVCIDNWNLSKPVPFRIIQRICICVPDHAVLKFTVNNFICQAAPFRRGCADFIRILVNIETRVIASAERINGVAAVCEMMDTVRMLSRACMIQGIGRMDANAYQYTAISDGTKRVYTNADELKKYGDKGIFSPGEVSYYNLYVNGVMQPKVNYIMTKGRLEFITEDLPTQGATIIIKYITFKEKSCVFLTDDQYYTIADGVKREYTNDDALKKYSAGGIPGPCEVSYYNLYVNGVLQPRENYVVERGLLKFVTADIPKKGRPIILESIAMTDACGHFLEVENYQYDILADKSRIYCSYDEITPYGQGILSPQLTSYQNLLVNSVNQTGIDYMADDGCLAFKTADLPTLGSPITLQSVRVLNHSCCGKPCDICMCLCLGALMTNLRNNQFQLVYGNSLKTCV